MRLDPQTFVLITIGFYALALILLARISHWTYSTYERLGTTNDLLRDLLKKSKDDPEATPRP